MKEEKNEKKNNSWIKPLRTYKSDATEALKKKGSSLVGIVLAEQKKKNTVLGEKITPQQEKKSAIIIVVSILLVLSGIIGVIYVFTTKEKQTDEPYVNISQGIIFTEKDKRIKLLQNTKEELSKKIKDEVDSLQMEINKIENIHFIKEEIFLNEGKEELVEITITTEELFSIYENSIPLSLLRSVNENFLFGLHSFIENNPFLLLTTNSYANTFSGMLLWEGTILKDIAPLFFPDNLDIETERLFEDIVIKNQDVRVIKDDLGEILFLYSFIDKNTLLLTTNETTLDEVIRRHRNPNRILQ